MACANTEVIIAIRRAIALLERTDRYQWGHMGMCNCGFLAQAVAHLTPVEIHRRAMTGHGDWSEQLNDYCPSSGLPFDEVIDALTELGFDPDDLKHLERLSDPVVLRLPAVGGRLLRHNHKPDVILYLRAWAGMLEEKWSLLYNLEFAPGEAINAV